MSKETKTQLMSSTNKWLIHELIKGEYLPLNLVIRLLSQSPETLSVSETLPSLLINDLANQLNLKKTKDNINKDKPKSSQGLLLLFALGLFGIIESGLWGFDGFYSVGQLFTDSFGILLIPSLMFALIAIFIFISFDVIQGAEYLEIDLQHDKSKLQTFIEEENNIKKILLKIDDYLLKANTVNDLTQLTSLINALNQRYDVLISEKRAYSKKHMPQKLQYVVKATSLLCGLLYFFDGFFTGQAGAMYLLGAKTFAVGMMNPFGLAVVLGLGIISAISTFGFYYMIQRPSVESLMSRLLGYPEEQLAEFTDTKKQQEITNLLQTKKMLVNTFTIANNNPDYEKPTLTSNQNGVNTGHKLRNRFRFFAPYPKINASRELQALNLEPGSRRGFASVPSP